MNKITFSSAIILLFFLALNASAQNEPIKVFDAYRGGTLPWMKYRHLENAWYHHITGLTNQRLDQREAKIKGIQTKEEWEAEKVILKDKLLKSIGGLPEKSPLNAEIVDVLDRETFMVEKIIYESLPKYFVTAALFIPKKRQIPAPAVIYCSGHADQAFRSETYQKVIINLVEKGFVVLAFDPIGQGERYQYLDTNGKPTMGNTKEHSYAGAQSLMVGNSIAKYMINDGIRAVDYLLTRPEVDARRIGITGRSGGGTQSAYIAAFDERIKAVAPENYITSFRRIFESIGPQDAEQNFLSGISMGIDHGDLLAIRAPKPALMITTTRDFFSTQGATETYQEVKNIYRLYGKVENVDFTEDDHKHGSTKANRESMYRFFQHHLNLPGNSEDQEVEIFSEEELTITSTGQVITGKNSKTTFFYDQLAYDWSRKTARIKKNNLPSIVSENLNLAKPQKTNTVFTGRINRGDYVLEKYFLEFSDDHYPIPFIWAKSAEKTSKSLILYLNEEGKSSEAALANIEKWVKAGYEVIAPDLLNTGELAASFKGDSQIEGVSYNLVFGSSLVGKSLASFQIEDLVHLFQFIKEEWETKGLKVNLIANGQLCIPAMHFSALETGIESIIFENPLTSWHNLLETKDYQPELIYSIVPGALLRYDLSDILIKLPTKKLAVINPKNAKGEALSKEKAEVYLQYLKETFEKHEGAAFITATDLNEIDFENFMNK